jgi:predicted peptidase
MKKKLLFPLAVSSFALLVGLTACGGGHNEGEESKGSSEPGTVETARKILNASIKKPVIELDQKTKVLCDVEGVTYRTSDANIASIDAQGNIEGINGGMARITVSKEGYFDKVLKVYVDDPLTVDYLVEGYEFGPAICGVKLNLEGKVKATDLANVQFNVKTNNTNRNILSVDLCDPEGEIINATESNYIRFSLEVTSSTYSASGGAQCFSYTNMNDWMSNIRAEVSIKSGTLIAGEDSFSNLTVNRIRSRIVTSTREWGEAKSHTAEGYTLTYKGFEPDRLREDGVLNPLVIWLHGAGEGGTDPDIAILGNDVTELGNPQIQSHFIKGQQKGAYVLAAQTPTMWMNSGSGTNNGGTGHSIYTKTLKSLIDKFIADNGDIDTKRIFVGGCSNGGYMTMEMAVNYGNFFRGFYPCCEAYSDSFVEDSDIAKLKDLPMWFIHAANDRTVNPSNFTLATYQRLINAGAKDIHLSYFTDVRGTQGNPRGNNYDGHWSWIYIFRDEVQYDQADPNNISAPSTVPVKDANGNTVNLFDWMESMK